MACGLPADKRAESEIPASGRFVVIALLALIACNVAVAQILPLLLRNNMLEAARHFTLQVVAQVRASESYLANTTVARVNARASDAAANGEHNGSVPVPLSTTMVFDSGNILGGTGLQVRLYRSGSRANHPATAFEAEAFKVFETSPDAVLTRVIVRNGQRLFEMAVSDNLAPSTPGVLTVVKSIEDDLRSTETLGRNIVIGSSIGSGLIGLALIFFGAQERARARERDALMLRLETAAYTDFMTGLLNRGRFMELGERMVLETANCRLFLIDVDHFKEVNDEFGHAAGDQVICETARRIRTLAGEDGLLARLGGDEFVLLRPAGEATEQAARIGAALVEALAQPFTLADCRLQLSASVGCAESATSRGNLDQLIMDADAALYRAKQAGRNRFVLFDHSFHNDRIRRRRIEKTLTRALAGGEFEYRYQPMFSAQSGRLIGFETLLRLRDRSGSYIPPAEFIPVAEDMRLMAAIGEQTLLDTLAIATHWPQDICVSINLSPHQFTEPNRQGRSLPQVLANIVDRTGIAAERVCLEITEGIILAGNDAVIEQLYALRTMGFSIALDDFGSGFSNLGCLWQFAFDNIKIDQSLTRGLKTNAVELSAIVRSITNMAHTLGMQVIAEGVETEEAAEFFRQTGCDALQGFLLGRPARLEEVTAVIATDSLRRQLRARTATDAGGADQTFQRVSGCTI